MHSLKFKLKICELYEVHWDDAYSYSGWWNRDELEKRSNAACTSIGCYIGLDKKGEPMFAGTIDTDSGLYNNIQVRPWRMIHTIYKVKITSKVKKQKNAY